MIEAGIFDLGGVVVYAGYKSIQGEIKSNFNVGDHEMWQILHGVESEVERGRMEEQEFWTEQSRRLGINPPVNQAVFQEGYAEEFEVIEGTIEMLRRLREKGIRLTALSNTIPSHAEVIRKARVFDLFDSVVLSYETGFRKPEEEIYRMAIEKTGKAIEQTVYIDDLPKNIDAANNIGLNGIVFVDPDGLRSKLEELGLVI